MSYAIIVGGVIALGSAAYGAAESSNQKRRARHQQAYLDATKPKDTIPNELLQNQELGKIRANTGLPSEQYAMAMKNIQRQQARTLKGATDRRMGLGLLASVDDNANRAVGNLDAQNAQARIQNERTLMGVNNQIAGWKTGQYNRQIAEWNNNMDYAKAVEGSANQNRVNSIMSGINAVGAIGGSVLGGNNSNSAWASGLFGRRKIPTGTNNVGGAQADYQAGW